MNRKREHENACRHRRRVAAANHTIQEGQHRRDAPQSADCAPLVPLGKFLEIQSGVPHPEYLWPSVPQSIPLSITLQAETPLKQAHLVYHSKLALCFNEPFFALPWPGGGYCVADYGGHRLCVLSPEGRLLATIGRRGRGVGELTRPLGLARCPAGGLYVADDAQRVQHFDEDGRATHCLGMSLDDCGSCSGEDGRCASGAVNQLDGGRGSNGCNVNFSAFCDRWSVWLPHGGVLHTGESPPLPLKPGELSEEEHRSKHFVSNEDGGRCLNGSRQWCADANSNQIIGRPCGVAIGPMGHVYVSDMQRDRVVTFRDSAFAYSFGERGSCIGQLHDPRGLTVHSGCVWVADMCNHRISVFSLRGRPLRTIGRYGTRRQSPLRLRVLRRQSAGAAAR